MTIVDGDVVDITNINRQLPALHSTVGMLKVDIVGDRLMDINPELHRRKTLMLARNSCDDMRECGAIGIHTPKLLPCKPPRKGQASPNIFFRRCTVC